VKAFVVKGIGQVGFMEKPELPNAAPGTAIIKPTRALVCTSDIHMVAGAVGELHDVTLGHEAVGVIAELGSPIRGLKEGDRVACGAITPCFQCDNCQRGYPSHCRRLWGGLKFGNSRDGVFADYFLVNDAAANLAPIPATVADEAAVYATDMMSTGLAGAENAAIPVGGTVAVFAQGAVGLMATAGARLLGAGLVIAVESLPQRQALARRFGADVIIDFTKSDPVEEIMQLTGRQGVDSAIDALGTQATFEAAVRTTRPGGTIVNIGFHTGGDSINIPRLAWGNGISDKTIRGVMCPGGRVRLERMLRLLETGRLDPTPLTTHRFAFAELETAFRLMEKHADGVIKPLIVFP